MRGQDPSLVPQTILEVQVPYIYKITNQINGKIYIGKTLKDISSRWREHCKAAKKVCCEKRPLYMAINKYGIENFKIE